MGLMADILNERKLVVKSGREEARMKETEARSNRMENQSGAIARSPESSRACEHTRLTRLEFPFLFRALLEKKVAAASVSRVSCRVSDFPPRRAPL